jgi:hypothetical protein
MLRCWQTRLLSLVTTSFNNLFNSD